MLNAVIQNNLSSIASLCNKHKVAKLYAFGSVCTDSFNSSSDIDFLVSYLNDQIPVEEYADNYFDFIDDLEKLLGKKVDMVSERSLKNPFFIERVEATKIPLYAA
jgi:predicted nucleotidyltransferase